MMNNMTVEDWQREYNRNKPAREAMLCEAIRHKQNDCVFHALLVTPQPELTGFMKAFQALGENDVGDLFDHLVYRHSGLLTPPVLSAVLSAGVEQENLAIVEKVLRYTTTKPIQEPVETHFNKMVQKGNLQGVKLFVEVGGVNPSVYRDQPFMFACSQGHEDIVDYLLGKGCNPASREAVGLQSAVALGHTRIVKRILDAPQKIPQAFLNKALGVAVPNGRLDIADMLIGSGADIQYNNNCIVVSAAGRNKPDALRYAIEKGADVRLADDVALMLAARSGLTENVKILLEHGADPVNVHYDCDGIKCPDDVKQALKTAFNDAVQHGKKSFDGLQKKSLPELRAYQDPKTGYNGLMLAALAGDFGTLSKRLAAEKQYLTVEDFVKHHDGRAPSLLTLLDMQGGLKDAFHPDLWRGRAKEMETVWKFLSDKAKKTVPFVSLEGALTRRSLKSRLPKRPTP